MVEGVVKQSGGTMTICSGPGIGTTVRLFLRRADAPAVPIDRPCPRIPIRAASGSTIPGRSIMTAMSGPSPRPA